MKQELDKLTIEDKEKQLNHLADFFRVVYHLKCKVENLDLSYKLDD